MYLKKIDLLGFKSFPGKTCINFEPGISCIVGPNGSGKSNIADALRWVLGEQNARTIRGSKLEDVIFSGSGKRKPLGMAEVTLTLDNSDNYLNLPLSEVTVTRRTFRGGNSEYQINDQSCRLKDIHDLFVDSGIGIEGVSVINQGQINELINARPDDRRELVEETAGIVKYRNRKREASRKLEETQRHLERVADIIGELEGRIEPLRIQSEAAQKWQELSSAADKLDIGISVKVLAEAKDKLTEAEASLDEAEQKILAEDTHRMQVAAEAEQLKLQISSLGEEVAELKQQFYQMQNQREKAEGNLALAKTNLANTLENRQRQEKEQTQLLALWQDKQDNAAQLTEKLAADTQIVNELEQQILTHDQGGQDLRDAVALLSERLEAAKGKAFELANQLAEQRNQIHYQQQLADKNNLAKIQVGERLTSLDALQQQAQTEIEEKNNTLAQGKSLSEQLSAEIAEAEKQLLKENEQIQQLSESETECQYQMHGLQTRLKMLEEMSETYQGFYPGVRGVLLGKKQGKPGLDGIIDVMANLLDVPEKYRVATEAYLGASLQNIATVSKQAANAAISYLKANDLGKATFLPLDILKPRPAADFSRALKIDGVYGRLSELVGCDKQIEPARDFMLNCVLLAKDMDAALNAAKALDFRWSVVTLDGDMVNPGASVSGGSRNKKDSALLERRHQLGKLQQQLAELQQQIDKHQQSLLKMRQRTAELNTANDNRRRQYYQLNNNALVLKGDIEHLQATGMGYRREQAALMAERQNLSEELLGIEDNIKEAEELQQQFDAENQQLMTQIGELQQQLQHKQELASQQQEDLTSQRVDLASQKQQLLADQKTIEQLNQDIENLSWDAEDKNSDLQELAKTETEQQQAISDADQEIIAINQQLLTAEDHLNNKHHGLIAEEERLGTLEKAEKQSLRASEELRNAAHQQQLKIARIQADWENEEAKLSEKYNMSFNEAKLVEFEELPRREMKSRLEALRQQIKEIGNVNLGAIEEYAEVDERFRFLTGQRDDLNEASQHLNQVIGEMDGIMAGRFRKAFNSLNEEFDKSFRRLFRGGSAQLVLSDPDDILETGVDILVSPPGKKVINHNLLSGGEKALIGIALMFAVLEVRPTPFCIMDEVDAALDEANIDRFTACIKEMAYKSQFVMISHRQSTMEVAESLWGVTMEEEGVSKLISVRFKDDTAQLA